MTKIEFDNQARELNIKKGNAIREIAALQSEIKEEIASKHCQIDEILKDISRLKILLQSYHQRRLALENEWNATMSAFIKENEPSTTSNLAEATIENILYELRRRSFSGIITDTETGIDFDINKAEWKREE